MPNKKKQLEDCIISVVTQTFKVPIKDIIRRVRKKEIANARQVIAYCLRLMTTMSFPEIGKLLGGRDHTTIIHSCKRIAEKIERDRQFRGKMESILETIRNSTDNGFFEYFQSEPEVLELPDDKDEEVVVAKKQIIYKIPTTNLVLDGREKEILSRYRNGDTLQEISALKNVTRERVRQIAFAAMLKEVGSKTKLGFEIDVDEYLKGEKHTHEMARYSIPEEDRNRLLSAYIPRASSYVSIPMFAHDIGVPQKKLVRIFPEIIEIIENNAKEKRDRWSRSYIMCRGCGTTTTPHVKRGYCKKCLGIKSKETREAILGKNAMCAVCSMDRGAAIRKYGKDLFILKNERILCRGCFLQLTGSNLGNNKRK